MNSLILISPSLVRGFQPIISGKMRVRKDACILVKNFERNAGGGDRQAQPLFDWADD
ncbi:hypothetical protein QUB63_30515 [Microcoleus sp. ARI1-B5]|uniref:hypothetical protein n=1 Tax=unclassified Microcoleus TaxID=2642155 RepID=UPI002FD3F002